MAGAVGCHAMPHADWPVLVSIPHAGRVLPDWVRAEARVSPSDLARLGDGWCDLIAAPLLARGGHVVKAKLMRAVADCNRHESDMDGVDVVTALRPRFGPPGRKARAGLGVIPARLPGIGPLWSQPLSVDGFEMRLDRCHRPFHRALADVAVQMLARHGTILLIDLHSMPPLPVSRSDPRPAQIIIGDRFGRSAASGVASRMAAATGPEGARTAINTPYAGGHIVEAHGAPGRGVHAVQVEFDRRLYLDRDGCADAARALALGEWLADRANDALGWLGLGHDVPLAAE
jgi:N-formylglutamate amidohydrolase